MLFAQMGTCQTPPASPSLQNTIDFGGYDHNQTLCSPVGPSPPPTSQAASNTGWLLTATACFGTWGWFGGLQGTAQPPEPPQQQTTTLADIVLRKSTELLKPDYTQLFSSCKRKGCVEGRGQGWEGGRAHRGGLGIAPGMAALCGPLFTAFPGISSRSAPLSLIFYLYVVIYWKSGVLPASHFKKNF